MYRKTTLPSGLRVLTETMPAVRSATVGVWADVGSAVESGDEARNLALGRTHALQRNRSGERARQIAETMDGVGGNFNAFTDKESTCYYAKVIDRHLPLAINVLADMFLNSTFDSEELRKEQNVVLEEIKMYDDSPDELIHDLFLQTMWNGSNFGDPTIGFVETITGFGPDDLRSHMDAHYAPNSVVVAAAGNLDHDRFVELVASEFAQFQGACPLPAPEMPKTTPARLVRHKDSEQAYVIAGTRGLSVCDDRRYALSILDTILGGGMSSRLFQEIREKRGLVYRVYSFQAAYRAAGLFGVYAGTSPAERLRLHRSDRRAACQSSRSGDRGRRASTREGTHQGKFDAIAGVDVEPDDPLGSKRVRARKARDPRGNRRARRCGDGRRRAGARTGAAGRGELGTMHHRPGQRVGDRVEP